MTPGDSMVISTCDIRITNRLEKAGKNGPYYMYESSVGTLVCFDKAASDKITNNQDMVWELLLAEPKAGFKYKTVKGVVGSKSSPKPAPAPAPAPARPSYGVAASGGNYVDKSSVFEAKDYRISKLSIFSSLVNLAAAKASGDAEFAKRSFDEMLLDIVSKSDMVTREFIYSAHAPEATSTIPETIAVSIPPAASAPVQQGGTTAAVSYSVPPSQTVAASPQVAVKTVSVPPVQPPAPVVPPTPAPVVYTPQVPQTNGVNQEEKAAAAGSLFGSGNQPDLEARMAARLKELTAKARK
jgi:hypothetical protein